MIYPARWAGQRPLLRHGPLRQWRVDVASLSSHCRVRVAQLSPRRRV